MLSLHSLSVYNMWNIPMILILSNYALITVISFIVLSCLRVIFLKNSTTNSNEHLILLLFNLIFFLNLAGLPPLPGFFIKINFLINIINYINIYTITILVIFNFTVFYLYIQFYKNLSNYTKVRLKNVLSSKIVLYLLTFLVGALSFYPIYSILISLII